MAMRYEGTQWLHGSGPFSQEGPAFTIEALVRLTAPGRNPTVIAQPASERWTPPYVAWRLGFFRRMCRPEFEVSIDGVGLVSVRAAAGVPLGKWVHIAGAFDGNLARLFVDCTEVGSAEARGTIIPSAERFTMGVRSSTDLDGFLQGEVEYMRAWKAARSAEDLRSLRRSTYLEPPGPADCIGLWQEDGMEMAEHDGFRPRARELAAEAIARGQRESFSFDRVRLNELLEATLGPAKLGVEAEALGCTPQVLQSLILKALVVTWPRKQPTPTR